METVKKTVIIYEIIRDLKGMGVINPTVRQIFRMITENYLCILEEEIEHSLSIL